MAFISGDGRQVDGSSYNGDEGGDDDDDNNDCVQRRTTVKWDYYAHTNGRQQR